MKRFRPRAITLRGRLLVPAPVEDVFPLFSPAGERLWVPNWDPEVLDPPESEWEEGQIFLTKEEKGDAVWFITRLDRALHEVEYQRLEFRRYVAVIKVSCQPVPGQGTEVSTEYFFLGTSEAGNRDIAAMTQKDYDAKMSQWAEWINRHLESKERGPDV